MNKILIGVSSCLLGEKVRYDGEHKRHALIVDIFSRLFELQGFCPEVEIGLGVPRTPIQLVKKNDQIRCIEIDHVKHDVTQALRDIAHNQKNNFLKLSGYIFKENSPSCGLHNVKVLVENQIRREGTGIFANEITKIIPYLPVEDEYRLTNPDIRKMFIDNIFMYHRWKQITAGNFSEKLLYQFHQRYKKDVKSHPQFNELEKKLAVINSDNFENSSHAYFCLLMTMFNSNR